MDAFQDNVFIKITPFLTATVALLSIAVTSILTLIQLRRKRRDDTRSLLLTRLDNQLSKLYGPLHAWYETGNVNQANFKRRHKDNFSFANPDYRRWLESIFMRTNRQLESLIVQHADLIVGEGMPQSFLQFCAHVATLEIAVKLSNDNGSEANYAELDEMMKDAPHPRRDMRAYIEASFEVLKQVQSRLLSGTLRLKEVKELTDDKMLMLKIELVATRCKEKWAAL